MRTIDAILNRFTMYRVVLYGLAGVLVIAEVLALTGAISISATGLLTSATALIVSCYVSNKLFAWLLHAATNTESWLISALIMVCLFPPVSSVERFLLLLLAGAIAMASKYLLVYRGSHIFNPAAIAAFVLSITGLVPATWWIATPFLAPFTGLLAFIVLRKLRNSTVFFSFAAAALLIMLYVSTGLHDQTIANVLKNAVLSWPIIFFGSIMLTEPTTLPATRYYQVLFALLVGAIFSSQLHIGAVSATPQVALLIGNLFTLLCIPAFGAMLRLKELRPLSPDIYAAVFERPKGLNFAAGQYLEWTLPHPHADGRGNRRIFSIASSPTEQDIQIGFRHYEQSSSFKNALIALQPGKYIRVAHVAGNFTLPRDPAEPLLFIAGGIGITPMRSMLQYLVDKGQATDVAVLYFASREQDFVYLDTLEQAKTLGAVIHTVIGRPDAQTIQERVPDFARRIAYLSGPDVLVSSCKRTLRSMGLNDHHIRTDHFTGY